MDITCMPGDNMDESSLVPVEQEVIYQTGPIERDDLYDKHQGHKIKTFDGSKKSLISMSNKNESQANKENQSDGPSSRKFMKIISESGSPHKRFGTYSAEKESRCLISSVKNITEENIHSRKRNIDPEIPKELTLRDSPTETQSQCFQTSIMNMTCMADESLMNSEDALGFLGEIKASTSIPELYIPKQSQLSNTLNTDGTIWNTDSARTGIFASNFLNIPSVSDTFGRGLIKSIEDGGVQTFPLQSDNMEMTCANTMGNEFQRNDSDLALESSTNILNNNECGVPTMSLSTIEKDESIFSSNKIHSGKRPSQHFISDTMDITCKSEYLKDVQSPIHDFSVSKLGNKTLHLNDMEFTCAMNRSLSEETSFLSRKDSSELNIEQDNIMSKDEIVNSLSVKHQVLPTNFVDKKDINSDFGTMRDVNLKKTGKKSLALTNMDITCMPDDSMDNDSLKANIDHDILSEANLVKSNVLYGKHQISTTQFVDKRSSTSKDFDVHDAAHIKKTYRNSLTLADMDITCMPEQTSENRLGNASSNMPVNSSSSNLQDVGSGINDKQNISLEARSINYCQDNKCNDKASVKRNIKKCDEGEGNFNVKRSKIATPGIVHRLRKFKCNTSPGLHENIYFSPEIKDLLKKKRSFEFKQPYSEMKIFSPIIYSSKKSVSFHSFSRESSFTEKLIKDQNISSHKIFSPNFKEIEDTLTPVVCPKSILKENNIQAQSTTKSSHISESNSDDLKSNDNHKLQSHHIANDIEVIPSSDIIIESNSDVLKSNDNHKLQSHHIANDIEVIPSSDIIPSTEYTSCELDKKIIPRENPLSSTGNLSKSILISDRISTNDSKLSTTQVSYLHSEITVTECSLQLLPNSILDTSIDLCSIVARNKGDSLLVNPNNVDRTVKESDTFPDFDKGVQIDASTYSSHSALTNKETIHTLEPSNIAVTAVSEIDQSSKNTILRNLSTKQLLSTVHLSAESVSDQSNVEILQEEEDDSVFEKNLQVPSTSPPNLTVRNQISELLEVLPKSNNTFHQDKARQVDVDLHVDPIHVAEEQNILPNLDRNLQSETGEFSFHTLLPVTERVHDLKSLNTTNKEEIQLCEKQNSPSLSIKTPIQGTELDSSPVSVQSDAIGTLSKSSPENSKLQNAIINGINNEIEQSSKMKNIQNSHKKRTVRMSNLDNDMVSTQLDTANVRPKKQNIEIFSIVKETVSPIKVLQSDQNPKPLDGPFSNTDVSMHQDRDEVPENIQSAADTEAEISIQLSQMEVGSSAGTSANEANNPPASTDLLLLKKKIKKASSGKEARWILKSLDENQAVFQLKWGPWLYKCRMMVYVDQINIKECRVSFATTYQGDDKLELIGYKCFKYLVSDEIIPLSICSETLIMKIQEYSNIATKVETLMRDIFKVSIGEAYTVSESLNPLRITTEVLNENLVSKFLLTFDVNLATYPCEKIIPEVKHLMFNDITRKVKDALTSIEPGRNYMWNMKNKADKL